MGSRLRRGAMTVQVGASSGPGPLRLPVPVRSAAPSESTPIEDWVGPGARLVAALCTGRRHTHTQSKVSKRCTPLDTVTLADSTTGTVDALQALHWQWQPLAAT